MRIKTTFNNMLDVVDAVSGTARNLAQTAETYSSSLLAEAKRDALKEEREFLSSLDEATRLAITGLTKDQLDSKMKAAGLAAF